MSLVKLPYELVSYVVEHLDLEETRNLSRACKHFEYLVNEASSARTILESKAPFSREAAMARMSPDGPRAYPRELRRLIKRREALSTVRPYLVAVVALTAPESWLYMNGLLVYITQTQRELRILNLHQSARKELVVNIRALLDEAIPDSVNSKKYKFQLLHCASDIVSCVYTHARPDQTSWLVVFDARANRVLANPLLASTYKIFVRNNADYLYYGTHSEFAEDGFRRWMVRGFDLKKETWFEQKMILSDMVGSDIGSTICFEIFGNFFYGLSSLTSFEVDEADLTSHYNCFRFPLDQPGMKNTYWVPRENMWRRQNYEGPIDDRWTFLKIFQDETTGRLKIIESRKEWLAGQSSARRTYYLKDVAFERIPESEGGSAGALHGIGGGTAEAAGTGGGGSCNLSSSVRQQPSHRKPFRGSSRNRDPSMPQRDEHMTHRGDDGSQTLLFTLSKCFIRAYYPECQSFIDLVDDPCSDWGSQRIRVRGASRRLLSSFELEKRDGKTHCLTFENSQSLWGSSQSTESKYEKYKYEKVEFFPPDPSDPSAPDPGMKALEMIMNPPNKLGNVRGVWDERSLVYETGGAKGDPPRGAKEKRGALVFVSFDPSIYLPGVRPYPGIMARQKWFNENSSTDMVFCATNRTICQGNGERDRGNAEDRTGHAQNPEQDTDYPPSLPSPPPSATADVAPTRPPPAASACPKESTASAEGAKSKQPWSVEATPLYAEIARKWGFYFGL